MNKKQEIRKQLDAGMAIFLSQGKMITKGLTHKPRGQRSSQPKEQMIEIQVDVLPMALQQKYFKEV